MVHKVEIEFGKWRSINKWSKFLSVLSIEDNQIEMNILSITSL